jgi:hypothetical protein
LEVRRVGEEERVKWVEEVKKVEEDWKRRF